MTNIIDGSLCSCRTTMTIIIFVIFLIGFKVFMKLTTGVYKGKRRLVGKTVIVTGADTGIGKETARDLAQREARVILACVDIQRGNKTRDEIISSTGNKNVFVRKLDLASLKSVRDFANEIIATEKRLDVLINNAGAGGLGDVTTEDGLQLGMQVNHFGPFLLTNLLLGVTVNSLHPGGVHTEIIRNMPSWSLGITDFFMKHLCKTAAEGAQTSIYLAVAEEVEGVTGKYFEECKESMMSSLARDKDLAKDVWAKSAYFVKL